MSKYLLRIFSGYETTFNLFSDQKLYLSSEIIHKVSSTETVYEMINYLQKRAKNLKEECINVFIGKTVMTKYVVFCDSNKANNLILKLMIFCYEDTINVSIKLTILRGI